MASASDLEMDWLSTKTLASMALNWPAYPGNPFMLNDVWQAVSYDRDAAFAYYDGIEDEDELRSLAAEALETAGWTPSSIAFKLS